MRLYRPHALGRPSAAPVAIFPDATGIPGARNAPLPFGLGVVVKLPRLSGEFSTGSSSEIRRRADLLSIDGWGVDMWTTETGSGWWLLEDGSTTYSYPVSIFGSSDDADLLAGRGATTQEMATWQFFDRSGSPALRSSYELVTALWDGGDRDLDKVWRRAGVEFATPDARATADSVTVTLYCSVDGGATWTSVATQNLTSSDSRLVSIGGALAARPESRFLQLKLTVTSISAWCPVMVGLWAEHETMDLPTRRRRWKFTVQISDAVVKRDSSVDATGARTLATGLWSLWDDGSVETFKDVDYDQTATSYSVRIAGILEVLSKPADVAMASSEIELTLVEV